MEEVAVHELAERADELLDRVAAGETVTITRDGVPVAAVRPVEERRHLTLDEILERRQGLPPLDLARLRADLDALIDPYS